MYHIIRIKRKTTYWESYLDLYYTRSFIFLMYKKEKKNNEFLEEMLEIRTEKNHRK